MDAMSELFLLAVTYPRACEAEGVEAVARRYKLSDEAVDLADKLAAWNRRSQNATDHL